MFLARRCQNAVLSVEDASGLPSIANMTATLFVTYPASWVHEDLHDAVVGVGPGDSLAYKIAIVEAYLAASDEDAACAMLADFRNQVSAQSGKKIDEDVATRFLVDAQEVMDAIPCQ